SFVAMIDVGSRRVITTDPRSECRQRINSSNLLQWKHSPSQKTFSDDRLDVKLLWSTVSRIYPLLCGLPLRVVSDIVQWKRAEDVVMQWGDGDDGKSTVIESQCRMCRS